jgi:hypothetical protein
LVFPSKISQGPSAAAALPQKNLFLRYVDACIITGFTAFARAGRALFSAERQNFSLFFMQLSTDAK